MFAKKGLIGFAVILFAMAGHAAKQSVSLNYQVVNNFPVKFVAVNLNDPEVLVTTAVSRSFPHGLESWSSFINRLQPDAAINGTYFSKRSLRPVGDIAMNGSLIYQGNIGTALCISPDNKAFMLPTPRAETSNWKGYRTVISAGPRLLTDRKLTINPRKEGFRDSRVLGSAPRSAVVIRKDGLMLLLTIEKNISLKNLAWVCLKLGAEHAMALDGGSSSALYAKGRSVTRPERNLSNLLTVYATPARYNAVANRFLPQNYHIFENLLPPAVSLNPEPLKMINPLQPVVNKNPVWFIEPTPERVVQGIVPVSIDFRDDNNNIASCALRINGQLKAITNTHPLVYSWDSSMEMDGVNKLQAEIWSHDNQLINTQLQPVIVSNSDKKMESNN